MATTFLDYKEQVSKSMEGLSFNRQLFFSVWITRHLFKQYGAALNEKFQDKEDLDLEEVLAFFWYLVDKAPVTIDDELLSGYQQALRNDDIYDNLDQNETSESGQANLISAFYNTLLFIRNKNPELVVGAAFFPLNVIDCILLNDLCLKDSAELINHPIYQVEFSAQTRMIAYLHSDKPAGSTQKDLFRDE